ncbi:DUF58 domain-containing protein [bacterium]|nr:DUF58 domain-containing protein [bacterium]
MTASDQLDTAWLSSLGDLSLVAKSVVEGFMSGLHRSPFLGYSTEFASYRQYIQGDNLKHVDWKVWGRTDELYVKQFEDDTNLRGHIFLDASGSMNFGEPNKFAYARLLAAALACLMSRQHDAPGLTTFGGERVETLPPRSHRNQIDDLLILLANSKADGETIARPELLQVVETMTRRGIAVVISDLFGTGDDLLEVLRKLRLQRQEVLLFHIVSPEEMDFDLGGEFLMEDSESGEVIPVHAASFRQEYLKRIEQFCGATATTCDKLEIDYRRLRTDQPLEDALTFYFEERMAM